MKIRKFTATNFRGFANENTFPVSERFTVIAGVNGRGKTSLLDGVALLVSRLFRSLGLSVGKQRTIASTDVFAAATTRHFRCESTAPEFRWISPLRSDRIRGTSAPRNSRIRSRVKSSTITVTLIELMIRRPLRSTTRRTALDYAFHERWLLNYQPDAILPTTARYQTAWLTTGTSWLAIASGARRREVGKSMHSRRRSASFLRASPTCGSKCSPCD